MSKQKGLSTALRVLMSVLMVVLVTVGLAPLLRAGQAQAAEEAPAKAWKNITMIYTTDVKGKIEPCG